MKQNTIYNENALKCLEVYKYTTTHYDRKSADDSIAWGAINTALREGEDDLSCAQRLKVARLDTAIDTLQQEEERLVFRGMSGDFVYNMYNQKEINSTFTDCTFWSVSYNYRESSKFACWGDKSQKGVLLVISGKKVGLDVLRYGLSKHYLSQAELLLKRRHTFRVIKKQQAMIPIEYLNPEYRGSCNSVDLLVVVLEASNVFNPTDPSVKEDALKSLAQRMALFNSLVGQRVSQDYLQEQLDAYDNPKCICNPDIKDGKHMIHCAWACANGA